eukprot:12886425-Prorocentrum_lima.AAC.1
MRSGNATQPAVPHLFCMFFAVDEGGNLSGGARQLLRRYARRDAAGSASADLDDFWKTFQGLWR